MKKYQRFPGKNHFCLGGRIIQGPDFTQIFYTISLIVVPSILYSIFVIPYLTREVSIAFPILFYPLLLFSLCSLFATSFTDPGILPRDLDHRNEDPNAQPLDANGLPPNYPFGELKPLVYETYNVNGVEVKNKYCATCKLARPPRSTHCGICDNCVERFDHHCPWVGTCVGKRNHRFFTLFGISTALLIGLALASCILHLYLLTTTLPPSDSNKSPFVQALAKAPVSAGLAIFTFFLIWSLGGLSAVHVHFSIVNMTTNEQIKNALQKNPYSRGYFTNFIYFFFGPISPSWIDRQGEIFELECHDV